MLAGDKTPKTFSATAAAVELPTTAVIPFYPTYLKKKTSYTYDVPGI